MLFVAICRDRAGATDVRANARPDHLAWLEASAAKVKLGGPFTA